MIKFIKSFLIITLLVTSISSCYTTELWKKDSYYKETFKDFLITKEGDKIIILGKKYHYIFDDQSKTLGKLLSWNEREKLELVINNLEILKSGKVSGLAIVRNKRYNDSSLSEKEARFLSELGLVKRKNRGRSILEKRIDLKGVRFLPKKGVNYDISSQFNKEYKVRISDSGFSDKVTKIALTPISVTLDGAGIVLVAGIIVALLSLTIPMVIVKCVADTKLSCR